MIRHPKVGQYVQVRYDKRRAKMFPFHGVRGQIVKVGRGDGPTNCLVRFQWKKESGVWSDRHEIFPRGNLVATEANEHGVFVDAERIEIFRKGRNHAEVRIAHEEGRWHWGYDLLYSNGYGGSSGGPRLKEWCGSRNEAILAALRVLSNSLRDRLKPSDEPMFREIEKQRALYEAKHLISKQSPPKQLDLFGAASFGG